jgi:outer membrane protein OmpA-like peptidoglycan-associated protein
MRFTVLMLVLLLVLVAPFALDWDYSARLKPRLKQKAEQLLAQNGLPDISVDLNYFDARLTGRVAAPEQRVLAGQLVDAISPLRVPEWQNDIRVAPKIHGVVKGEEITLSGWVKDASVRADLLHWVKKFRPDLKIDSSALQVSQRVEHALRARIDGEQTWKPIVDLIDGIRVPPSFSIQRKGEGYAITGCVKTAELHDAMVKAAQENPSGWPVDVTHFTANTTVQSVAFAESMAMADFVRSFFRSPTPGELKMDLRSNPQLKAHATSVMESEWLALLRPITGAARVDMQLTRLPSLYHFPDYKYSSVIPEDMRGHIRTTLASYSVRFDLGSSDIKPEEDGKLRPLVPIMQAAGSQAKFIIAAYADPAGEPGAESQAIQRARAVNVYQRLLLLGADPAQLEMIVFDKLTPDVALTEEVRYNCRKAELLIK